jgi:serine protease Do
VAAEIGLRGIDKGVVIADVKDGSAAANVGLQPGDVIAQVNGVKIKTVADLRDAAGREAGRWRITMQRGGNSITIMVGG